MKIDWNMVSALAAMAAALAAIIALLLQGMWSRRANSVEFNWRAEEQFFRNESMLEKRRRAGSALLQNETTPELDKILDFFETIGFLVKKGILDKEFVCSVFYNRAIAYWYGAEDHVKSERVRYKSENLWHEFQELIGILHAVRRKNTRSKQEFEAAISPASIRERLLDESKAS